MQYTAVAVIVATTRVASKATVERNANAALRPSTRSFSRNCR